MAYNYPTQIDLNNNDHIQFLQNKYDQNIYLFTIKLANEYIFHLSSVNSDIIYQNNIYYQDSKCKINQISLLQNAQNKIYISGVYESEKSNGINKYMDLSGAKIEILEINSRNHNQSTSDFITHKGEYICTSNETQDYKFILICTSNILMLNKNISKMVTKNCTATLGDKYCKLKSIDYQYDLPLDNITNIQKNIINHKDDNLKQDFSIRKNFYENGIIKITLHKPNIKSKNQYLYYKIINQTDNSLILQDPEESNLLPNITNIKEVKLIANCSKKFDECCNKFNNEVNFRGFPHIKENILSNEIDFMFSLYKNKRLN